MTEVTATCTHEQRVNVRQIQDPPWLIREMCTWCSAEILTNQTDPPMTTQPRTLTDFLLARITEDERRYSADPSEYGYGHAFRMAECEAKRQIVALHEPGALLDHSEYLCTCGFSDHRRAECACGWTIADEGEWERPSSPCPTLRHLAQPYADHPDFRSEWRA